MSYLKGAMLDEPDLLFDRTDTSARNKIPFRGLMSFGPYDKSRPKISIVLLAPQSHIDSMRRLVESLNNGSTRFPGGFKIFFRSRIEILGSHVISSSHIDDYLKISHQIIKIYDPRNVDLILCYIPYTSKYITNTPYYLLKTMFTSHGFPSQMVTSRTFANLEWSYLNLAVAIFSKTGGTPWVLADGYADIDMMVGVSISNRITAKSRAGTRPRYVGCINVFDRYGRWMFFEGTARLYNEDKKSRRSQLEELFSNCCAKFEAEQHKTPRNIVVHYYKKFSRFEIEALEEFLDNTLDEHSLACVSINSHHPYRVYNKTVSDWSYPRGAYVEFGKNQYLLSTTGETPIAGRRMGTPRLLHINIRHKTDGFVSNEELIEGVFGLTKLNWATSMPMVREPMTLSFSESIAYLTAVLSEEEWKGITDAQVNPMLSGRPWFI